MPQAAAIEAPGFLFAGQGAQYVGMGTQIASAFPEVYEAYGLADNALGEALSTLIMDGPQERLTLTENAQPAILALGYAHARIARRFGVVPRVLLGHSLGEYAAWVTAGSLRIDDAIQLVRVRGRAMQKAVPVGVGAMTAVISTPTETIDALCVEIGAAMGQVLSASVYNCPGNVVVSGHTEAVEALEARITADRLGTCRRLEVSAPFHCSLLSPAADELARALALVEVLPNVLPVVPNVTAEVVEPGCEPAQIRRLLVEQVVQPVRWEGCLRAALSYGIKTAVLMGPGTMTRSHLKRVDRRFPTVGFDDPNELTAWAGGGAA